MKTNFNKPNPKRLLGYLMAAAMMVFFSTSYAQNACTVTVDGGSYQSEVSWDITDANGAIIASGACPASDPVMLTLGECYDMNMYDSYGDGWNGNTYTITDDLDGTVYATGGITAYTSAQTDNFCPTAAVTCTDNVVLYTAGSWSGENDFTITDCAGNVLASMTGGAGFDQCIALGTDYSVNLVDTYGDGWNGGTLSIDGVVYTLDAINDDGASASFQVGYCAVYGCTDATAANYDPAADTDDGSCTYDVLGCMDSTASNYDASANVDDGSCCYNDLLTLTLYDSWGDGWGWLGTYNSVTINGVDYTTDLAQESFTLCLDASACTEITFNDIASYSSENSWDLVDASGAVLASGGNTSSIFGNDPGFDCAGNCLSGDAITLNLYDSYGDGWGCYDGTESTITFDGNTYTCTGSSASFALCADLTTCTDIVFTAANCWDTECSWDVTDASGAVIASGANNSGDVGACAVYGCTDPAAANYDPAANTDDGSCIICNDNWVTITCGGGSYQSEVSWTLTNSSGTVVALGGAGVFGAPETMDMCLPNDCYTLDMVDSYGDGWNGNVFDMSISGISIGTATIATGSTGSADFSVGAICYVYGCTDAAAVNYDAAATADDGSCVYSCTAAPYCENFDLGVGTWTNNGWSNNYGGTSSSATGPTDDITGGAFYMYYETSGAPAASIDMTSECLDISSLANPALSFYNHMFGATIGDLNVYVNGNLEWTMSGNQGDQWNWIQVDLSAYAGVDVTIMIEAVYGGGYTGDIAIDNVCVDEFVVISGCTDPIATNYDATANTDDGSCTYCPGTMLSLNMYDSYGDGWNGAEITLTGSNGSVFGPFTVAASSALEMLCMDDDCYAIDVTAGSWPSEISWDVSDASGAVLASGGAPYNNAGALSVNVTCPVYGCTDATALNFDSLATADDGSCAYLCDVYVATASVDASPSCNGAFDASATCYIDGSFGADFYQWDDANGQTTSTATGLAAGTYTCTATDSINGCVSIATVVIDPTPVISISAFIADATPGNANGSIDITVSGGTPCYNGAAISLAGAPTTSTQWASNVFDVVATSDLQITSIDQPFMSGAGTADVYYRLGSGSGFEADPNGWMLAGSASIATTFIGDMNNIPVNINVNAGETVCIYVQGIGVNTVFGAGVDSTYNSVVSSDANLSIIGGFATGGAPGSGTTYPSAGSYDFGGNINYSLANYTYAWSNGTSSEDATGLPLGPISVTVTDCNGCTGSWTGFVLTNYVYGCMDSTAANYDAAANTSWDQDTTGATPECLYPGCTDAAATNFDASANQDDGSCTYSCAYYGWDAELTVTFTPDWYSDENSWYIINAVTGDTALASQPYASGGAVDVQTLCAMNGCYYVDGYDTYGDGWGFGSGTLDIVDAAGNSVLSGFTLMSGSYNTSSVFSIGGANCTAGCTDTAFANFDVNAVIEDGSCSDSIVGCTDPSASNYTPFSNYDDGSCCYDNLVSVSVGGGSWQGEVGWTLSLDTTISVSGGAPYAGDLCLPDGCYTVDMTDSYGDGWNGNVFEATSGGAVIGSGGLTSGAAGSFTFAVGTGDCAVFGCTDPAASNYDATATDDDGSCCLDNWTSITTGIDYLGTPYEWEFNGMEWAVTLLGDTVPSGIGSNDLGGIYTGGSADLCLPDGCYEFDATDASGFGVYAWFNINGTQYDPPASGGTYGLPYNMYFEVGNAICPIMGCTDPNSADYDSTATYDDGSCTYPCLDTEVSLNLYDSYGDGWNGGILTVNGVDYTVTAGASASFVLCLDLSGCIDVIYTAGSWSYENSWDITDSSGAVIASGPNASGTVGNGCIYLGCTDPAAFNYDPTANTDDGSCNYCADNNVSMVTTDAYGFDWGWTYGYAASWTITDLYDPTNTVSGPVNTGVNISTLGVESVDLCLADGCYEVVTSNLYTTYDSYLTWDFAGATGGVNTTSYVAVGAATCPVMGCTDSTADNYDASATYDDGSCTYPCLLDEVTLNLYDSYGDGWNGGILTVDGVDYTMATGSAISFGLCIDLTACTDIIYTAGSWSTENSWDITDASGAILASGPNASGQVGYGCPVYGCTDSTAANYDAAADTDDGSCDYLGCTNPTATNYDATATIDDGSCVFGCQLDEVTLVLNDSYGDGWNGGILTVDGVDYTIAAGATATFTNICIDLAGCTDLVYTAGSFSYENSWEVLDASGAVIASGGDNSGTVGSGCPVYGCTDPAANNYDASANTDDGSCTYCTDNVVVYTAGSWSGENDFTITDCAGNVLASMTGGAGFDQCIALGTDYSVNLVDTYGDGWNGGTLSIDGVVYTLDAINDDGASASFQVGFCAVYGCTDPTALNYDASANTDDGSCTYCVDGCMDATQFNYDPNATCDDGSCIPYTYGCTDATASNYNSTVNTDDGSCIWLGCTDATADNYDATATVDDGSCTYPTDCAGIVNGTAVVDSCGVCQQAYIYDFITHQVTYVDNANILVPGMDYDPSQEMVVLPGSAGDPNWNASCSGCTDPAADNYDASATLDNGSCTYDVLGCTDATANNYDATATVDDGSCTYDVLGCTDATADNYDATATVDDGSCTYPTVCTAPSPTGAYVTELTHDRVRFNWDDMNSSTCMVEQYRIRYREVGTSAWSSKTMSGSGLCVFGLGTTSKMTLNLQSSTTYEYYMKAWYCGGSTSGWSALQTFTTEDECQNVTNFTVSTPTTTKADFAWDTISAYSFVRLQLRVDTTGATWFTAGGFGVFYPLLTKSKNGLVSGESYRASARTWCNPNGGPYRSATWTTPIFWTQPTSVRIDGGAAIANLDVYPNPSRDVFNVAFTSEDVQDLEVRVINVVGEVVYTENLQQFVGEYTKSLDLESYTKGVYFLEITTNNGVVNKKLILQ